MSEKLTCFLIDNDIDDQEIFCMALRDVDEEISCTVADNGVAALQKLSAQPDFVPSFIFIDMNMPLMTGNQCLQGIKKIDRLSNVPVYVYSTSSDPHTIAEAKRLGAADFFVKPAGYQKFVQLLSAVIKPVKSE
jgi:DNA-binding NtrC family response regulator